MPQDMEMPAVEDGLTQQEMPQMDAPQGSVEPPMNNGTDPMDGGSEFDSDFDAGVDANEEEDPKKYIQQLTGKLSQSLRTYNQGLPHPDEDLCKFVAGMVVSQAIKGLNPEDAEEVLKKIKSDDDMSEYQDDDTEGDMQDEQTPQDSQMEQPEPMGECLHRRHQHQIDEIFNDIISDEQSEEVTAPTVQPKNSYRKMPFTSPSFK